MINDIRDQAPPTETILVVDDEPYILNLIGSIFSIIGYQVLLAKSGANALDLCLEHKGRIDLLLTDVMMPGMNGKQLWERFCLYRPEAKVLFISGFANDVLSGEGFEEANYPFLRKPFTPRGLADKVREVLGSSVRDIQVGAGLNSFP